MLAKLHTWEIIRSWHNVLPPSRPSERELRWLARMIARTVPNNPSIAILGSTPEFRDIAFELNAKVYVFERSVDTFKYMSTLRRHSNEDVLIEGDWINTLPDFSSTFDFVLSDLTSGNIPYESRTGFYRSIAKSLKPNGLFYDKVLTHSSEFLSSENLITRYRRKPLNMLTANHFSCEFLFCSDLLPTNGLVDSSAFYDIALELDSSPSILALVALSELVTPRGCFWYYGRPWVDLAGEYLSSLDVIQSFDDVPISPYFGRAKLFLSKSSGL